MWLVVVLGILITPLFLYVGWHVAGLILSVIVQVKEKAGAVASSSPPGRVAILYTTANDFDADACRSLLTQKQVEFDLFILDDSTHPEEKERIDRWVADQNHHIVVLRRTHRTGFKGGNINHWLQHFGNPEKYPYLLLVDADEYIPPTFTYQLLTRLADSSDVFVQACHQASKGITTRFQHWLHPQLECEQRYLLAAFNFSGMPPLIGHGALLRTHALQAVGGFPDVVSEDVALTIALAQKGWRGSIVTSINAFEGFPQKYASYWQRRLRWIQADTEVVRKMGRQLWQKQLGWLPRLVFSLRELRLPLASTYWLTLLLCSVVPLSAFLPVSLSPLSWLALPVFVIPLLPALTIGRLSWPHRLGHILMMSFVGAATTALHPVAVITSLAGYRDFQPTGSRYVRGNRLHTWLTFWEIGSGILFIGSGLMQQNFSLAAMGTAIGLSPLMRTTWQDRALLVGTTLFWGLIITQIILDSIAGQVPLEHILPLLGLPLTLVG
jgi:hypothetical protein